MNPMTIGWIVLTCVFGGALLGMVLHRILPAHHLSTDSKDVIKLGMGLTATMSALVLALLIASALNLRVKGVFVYVVDCPAGCEAAMNEPRLSEEGARNEPPEVGTNDTTCVPTTPVLLIDEPTVS